MAEVNANSLPAKTDLGTNDSAIVVDQTTNAGALVDLDVLADKVLDRLTSKTFANQVGGSSAATLLAQLSTLNSKITSFVDITNQCTAGSHVTLQRVRAAKIGSLTAVYVYFTPDENASLSNCVICDLPSDYYFSNSIYTAGTSDNQPEPYTFELAAAPARRLTAYYLKKANVPFIGLIIA